MKNTNEKETALVSALTNMRDTFHGILQLNTTAGNPLGIMRDFHEEFEAAALALKKGGE